MKNENTGHSTLFDVTLAKLHRQTEALNAGRLAIDTYYVSLIHRIPLNNRLIVRYNRFEKDTETISADVESMHPKEIELAKKYHMAHEVNARAILAEAIYLTEEFNKAIRLTMEIRARKKRLASEARDKRALVWKKHRASINGKD